MSNAARKARKREGQPYEKPEKVVTPVDQRLEFRTASPRKQIEALQARGVDGKEMSKILTRSAIKRGIGRR